MKKMIEKPDKTVDFVEKILSFKEKYQEGQGLNI